MKKGLIYLFMLVLGITSFTACNDDDKDNGGKPTDNAEAIAGIYRGDMAISFSKTPDKDTSVQNIYITRTGKDVIKVELKKFKFGVISVGDITVENINVVNNNGTYSFTGSQALKLVVGEVNVDVTGTVSGNEGTLQIIVKDVVVVGDVTVKFVGNKVTGLKTDAQITAMTFSDTVVVGQPVINGTAINFYVAENADSISLIMAPTITVSEGASVSPVSGVKVNFNAPVTYTVTAEDGVTTATYTVSCQKLGKYDFENWSETNSAPEKPELIYYEPDGWATCNAAVYLIKGLGFLGGIDYTGPYPVTKSSVAQSGKLSAEITSLYTIGGVLMGQKVPKVTSGTIFLGSFNAIAAMEDPMATTEFGIPYDKKPISVKGFYKYKRGETFYNVDDIDPDMTDELAISAVLYEVTDLNDASQILNGRTIYSADNIVAIAQFTSGDDKTAFTPFELPLNYVQEYSSSKLYRFAVIFASSKEGAAYKGAVNSTLTVDDVEIISE